MSSVQNRALLISTSTTLLCEVLVGPRYLKGTMTSNAKLIMLKLTFIALEIDYWEFWNIIVSSVRIICGQT